MLDAIRKASANASSTTAVLAVDATAEKIQALDHDAITQNRIVISSLCLSMIFSENRFPLFRIML